MLLSILMITFRITDWLITLNGGKKQTCAHKREKEKG